MTIDDRDDEPWSTLHEETCVPTKHSARNQVRSSSLRVQAVISPISPFLTMRPAPPLLIERVLEITGPVTPISEADAHALIGASSDEDEDD